MSWLNVFTVSEKHGRAHDEFVARFRHGAMPEDIAELTLTSDGKGVPIANLLKEAGLTESTSESLRMIKQGAVRIDGERLAASDLCLKPGSCHVYQVGKRRFARVTVAQ